MNAGKIVLTVALMAAASAMAQSSRRADTWEIYLAPTFTDGKSYSFEGGSSAKTDTGFGFTFGLAKNLNSHLTLGGEWSWNEQDYRATVQPGTGNTNLAGQINGTIESSTIRLYGTYNFSEKSFTPFVTGGLGWTYIDSNIPAGLPESFCWYYPWYGSYCASYVPTATSTKFSYNVGAGLRLDAGKGVFRFLVNYQWVDLGGSYGSADTLQYRLDIGTKF